MNFKKFWKIYLIWFAISALVGTGIFLGFYLGRGPSMTDAQNGTSLAAIVLICVGGLCFVAREGFFDIFAYGFKQMGAMIFTKDPNSLKDFPGYKEDKKNLRKFGSKYYLISIFVGLLFLISYIVLKIIASK